MAATVRYGRLLWGIAVAGATSLLCRVGAIETTTHATGATELSAITPGIFGRAPHTPAARAETPCLALHTGWRDKFALRRFPVIGAPSAWVSEGLVNYTGLRMLEMMAHAMKMGMAVDTGSPSVVWVLFYKNVDVGPGRPPIGLAYRRVEFVHVLQHTTRAPDPALGG